MGVRKPWKGCTMAEMEIDKKLRNWSEYNERLVRRGEMYIDLDFGIGQVFITAENTI